jgi:hypothetical protein
MTAVAAQENIPAQPFVIPTPAGHQPPSAWQAIHHRRSPGAALSEVRKMSSASRGPSAILHSRAVNAAGP